MRTTHEVQQTVLETKDIICNQCGNSCRVSLDAFGSITEYEGLIEAEVCAGYGSKFLGDGNGFAFSLCEECLVKLFKTFKHPALTRSMWEGTDDITLDGLWQEVVG